MAVRLPKSVEPFLAKKWVLWAALGLGLLLRLGHILALKKTPWFDALTIDPQIYDEWAQRLAAGDWLGTRIFHMDPLYPYFLGGVYRLFGRDFLLLRLLQAGFGVASCYLTALVGRRLFGEATGNVAGLFAAVFLPSVFYEAEVEKTFLAVFLTSLFMFLWLRDTRASRFGAGAALALTALTRANLLAFIPVAALWSWIRGRAALAALFLAGALAVLTPVAWRNHKVGGEWVLTTSSLGQNFYLGNNPRNTTGGFVHLPFERPNPKFEEEDFKAEAESRSGRPLGPSEVSAFWLREGLDHLAREPAFALRMFAKKFALFWNDYEVPDNQDIYFLRMSSWVLRLPFLGFGALFLLAVLGAALHFRTPRVKELLVFAALYCLAVVAFFVLSRYRMAVVPALVVLAAAGAVGTLEAALSRRWKELGVLGGLAAVAGAFTFFPIQDPTRTQGFAQSYTNMAALLVQQNRFDEALEAYRKALEVNPKADYTLRDLGVLHRKLGHMDEAEKFLKSAVQQNPRHPDAWLFLAKVYEETDRLEAAAISYRKALEVQPGNPEVAFALAAALGKLGKHEEAVALYQKVLLSHPKDARVFHNLAVALRGAGRLEESRAAGKRAEELGLPLPPSFWETFPPP